LNWDRIAKHLTCLRFRTTCGSGPKSKFHVVCAVHTVMTKTDLSQIGPHLSAVWTQWN